MAQSFTTGAHRHGYVLSIVVLRLETDADPVGPTVKLFSGSANGTEEATLALQGTLTPSTTVQLHLRSVSETFTIAPSDNILGGGRRRRYRMALPALPEI